MTVPNVTIPPVLILIGMRGAGKSTVGRALAERLARPFIDLDAQVLDRFGANSVIEVWEEHGESAWRHAEDAELARILNEAAPVVLALGGGVPMIESARARLESAKASGLSMIFHLMVDAATIRGRLMDAGDRPSLTGATPAEEAEAVLAKRLPVYGTLASTTIDARNQTPAQVADRIAATLYSDESE